MKKRVITILIGLLFCIVSIFLASCKDEGDAPTPEPTPTPEAPASPDTGAPEETIPDTGRLGVEIETLSFRYLTESEYNEGDFSDELLRETAFFEDEDPYCYMVLDITYRKEKGSVELGDLDVLLKIPSRGVLDMRIEEAATSKITEERDGDGVSCSLSFSIPTSAEEQKTERIVLRLLAVSGGEESICVSFGKNSSATLVSSQLTERITTGKTLFSYRITTDGSYYIVSSVHADTVEAIEIPEKLGDNVPVGCIDAAVFQNCTQLKKVVLSPSLRYILDSAFEGCTALTDITMPKVESIGAKAFSGCTGLTSIALPDTIKSVGANAFSEELMLTHDNAQYLGNAENPYLVLVKTIDKTATAHTVPEGTRVIADSAFYKCDALLSVDLPASVVGIGKNAFRGCVNLSSVALTSVTIIGEYAFYECKSFTAIELSSSLTAIGSWAFGMCVGLTAVQLPNTLTRLESCVFSGCWGLTDILIPTSLKFIGQYAFSACADLHAMRYAGTVAEWNALFVHDDWRQNSGITTVVCSDGTVTL